MSGSDADHEAWGELSRGCRAAVRFPSVAAPADQNWAGRRLGVDEFYAITDMVAFPTVLALDEAYSLLAVAGVGQVRKEPPSARWRQLRAELANGPDVDSGVEVDRGRGRGTRPFAAVAAFLIAEGRQLTVHCDEVDSDDRDLPQLEQVRAIADRSRQSAQLLLNRARFLRGAARSADIVSADPHPVAVVANRPSRPVERGRFRRMTGCRGRLYDLAAVVAVVAIVDLLVLVLPTREIGAVMTSAVTASVPAALPWSWWSAALTVAFAQAAVLYPAVRHHRSATNEHRAVMIAVLAGLVWCVGLVAIVVLLGSVVPNGVTLLIVATGAVVVGLALRRGNPHIAAVWRQLALARVRDEDVGRRMASLNTARAGGWSASPRLVLVSALVAGIVLAVVGLGWTVGAPTPHPELATDAVGTLVLVSGTSSDPQPALSGAATDALRAAWTNLNGRLSRREQTSVVVRSTDGLADTAVPLRSWSGVASDAAMSSAELDGEADFLRRLDDTVASVVTNRPNADLLAAMANVTRGRPAGLMIVVGSGLNTSGAFDLRRIGWDQPPTTVASELANLRQLPDLTGWQVVFSGLGRTAGQQPPLPAQVRDKLVSYWLSICQTAGAEACHADSTADDTMLRPPSASAASAQIVPVPGVEFAQAPSPVYSISDEVLGFGPDSADIPPTATLLLAETAARIEFSLAGSPAARIRVTGYTAAPAQGPSSGPPQLSQARAEAVVRALVDNGVTHPIDVARAEVAQTNGLDPTLGRRVEIRY
jgi:outer membrane protein OmpA-like peptidoglycan-associated protein